MPIFYRNFFKKSEEGTAELGLTIFPELCLIFDFSILSKYLFRLLGTLSVSSNNRFSF